jgi:hypothetical protein
MNDSIAGLLNLRSARLARLSVASRLDAPSFPGIIGSMQAAKPPSKTERRVE